MLILVEVFWETGFDDDDVELARGDVEEPRDVLERPLVVADDEVPLLPLDVLDTNDTARDDVDEATAELLEDMLDEAVE